tara:strand:+ start:1287 stop:2000 length:714 start_codon:yes stop_codon:yes gene_type:complete
MKSTIAKVIYLGILPAAGTYVLLFSMFHVELGHLYDTVMLSSESDTSLKLVGITMCALTWFAAFQYWNFFIREFSVQMTEAEVDEYKEYEESYNEGYNEDSDESYNEPEKVELDSPIKGLCRPFIVEHSEVWMKNARGSWGNGYILISSDHPWSGKDAYHFEHTSSQEITFSGTFSEQHLKDAGFEKEIYENADKYWVFGFDTLHIYNSSVNNKDWVGAEAVQLAADFKKAFKEGVE